MSNKKFILSSIAALIVLGIGGLYFYYNNKSFQGYNSQQEVSQSQNNNKKEGRIVLGITDAASSMGKISSIFIDIQRVQLHSKTNGWITISNEINQFDLLKLKQSNEIAMLSDSTIEAGTYDQIRLDISKVVLVEDGVQKEAKLPSQELKIMSNVVINGNSITTSIFDFIADESLHVTGNNQFIFTPVIILETRSNVNAQVNSNNELKISGGSVQDNKKLGMDINGEMKTNFTLDSDVSIDLIDSVLKVYNKNENDDSVKIKSDVVIDTVLKEDYLDTVMSIKLDVQNNEKIWIVSGIKDLALTDVIISAETGLVLK